MKTAMRISGFDNYRERIDEGLGNLERDNIIARIWQRDYHVWKSDPAEIENRLGWLDAPRVMAEQINRIERFTDAARTAGFTGALLLGMGGSSLAPEVLRQTFGFRNDYLDLSILDSTDPGAILYQTTHMNPARTLAVVSTKSGTTVETISLFKLFYNLFSDELGSHMTGRHFAAITDPGSPLVGRAERSSFRDIFLNDPHIGGRYSALSFFGLVPASLCGINVSYLLIRGAAAAQSFSIRDHISENSNPAAFLGLLMALLAREGRDKLTLVISPQVKSFGCWLEQLIAESLGKEGRGLVPVIDEPAANPAMYGRDRFFVYLRVIWDRSFEDRILSLRAAGFPVITIEIEDLYELGAQFFFWQAAVALAGHVLSVNPFDQPDVESSKIMAREMIGEFLKTGRLSEEVPSLAGEGMSFFGDTDRKAPSEAFRSFLDSADPDSYVALQAYLQRRAETDQALAELREAILHRIRCATTMGYGPRYLHSTGQLHKGGGSPGVFIQLTANDPRDVPVPDEEGKAASSLNFGTMKAAQAQGDRRALTRAGKRVIRIHLADDLIGGIRILTRAIA